MREHSVRVGMDAGVRELALGQPTTAASGRLREEGCTLECEMNTNEVMRESARGAEATER